MRLIFYILVSLLLASCQSNDEIDNFLTEDKNVIIGLSTIDCLNCTRYLTSSLETLEEPIHASVNVLVNAPVFKKDALIPESVLKEKFQTQIAYTGDVELYELLKETFNITAGSFVIILDVNGKLLYSGGYNDIDIDALNKALR